MIDQNAKDPGIDADQTLQMFHEYLQADIIRKDGLPRPSTRCGAIHRRRHVRCRRVEFRQKETCLTPTLIANNVPGNGEPVNKKILR
jgi:hypothetical protein